MSIRNGDIPPLKDSQGNLLVSTQYLYESDAYDFRVSALMADMMHRGDALLVCMTEHGLQLERIPNYRLFRR